MDYVHELITPEIEIPIKVFINSVKNVQRHWHNSLELILILDGGALLFLNEEETSLKNDDFVIINSNQVHSLSGVGKKNLLLTLQLPKKNLLGMGIDLNKIEFRIPRNDPQNKEIFIILRSLMAEIALTNLQQDRFYVTKVGELVHKLVYLISYYFSEEKDEGRENIEDLDRLSLAIGEIQNNFNTNLTLNDVAKVQGLSRNYFAHFFKKHMGITFLEYLNGVRLEHAYKELLYTNKTITDIALDNGFPNSKSFAKTFRDIFKETPSTHRVNQKKAKFPEESLSTISYFDIEGINKNEYLYKYLQKKSEKQHQLPVATHLISHSINLKLKGRKRENDPLSLITFGRASTGLKMSLQSQLREAQKDIGFKYVRFHGILDDDMGAYAEESDGTPVFNFRLINSLMDFLLEINIKPLLELAFMPSKLAKNIFTLWEGKSYISMPKDMNIWNNLIRELIINFIDRYGIEEVCSWKFEIWNEPEYRGIMWNDSEEDFFALWENTYKTIKLVDPALKVGGPSIFINTIWAGDWFEKFVYHCKKTQTVPDFLTIHFYPLESVDFTMVKNISEIENQKEIRYENIINKMEKILRQFDVEISKDPSYLKTSIHNMKSELKKYRWDQIPVHLTEWNSTTWQRDLANDTVYKSAYIVKNILENLDDLKSFGYWTLSDYMEELSAPKEIFHGGFGLMTTEGIKKAGYFAFSFLKNLGENIHEQNENYSIFTSDTGVIQILLYNYIHPNNLYRKFDTSNITKARRYDNYENNRKVQIDLSLNLDKNTNYIVKKQVINRNSGSAFDEWVEMGATERLTTLDIENLKKYSQPKTEISTKKTNPNLEISHILHPHEVCLIEIIKK